MAAKYCPMRFLFGKINLCIEEKCAWWDGLNERCSILSINANTFNLLCEKSEEIKNA